MYSYIFFIFQLKRLFSEEIAPSDRMKKETKTSKSRHLMPSAGEVEESSTSSGENFTSLHPVGISPNPRVEPNEETYLEHQPSQPIDMPNLSAKPPQPNSNKEN